METKSLVTKMSLCAIGTPSRVALLPLASAAAGEWQPRETSASAHRSDLLGGWSPYMKDQATARQLETVASTPPSDDPPAEHHATGRARGTGGGFRGGRDRGPHGGYGRRYEAGA